MAMGSGLLRLEEKRVGLSVLSARGVVTMITQKLKAHWNHSGLSGTS